MCLSQDLLSSDSFGSLGLPSTAGVKRTGKEDVYRPPAVLYVPSISLTLIHQTPAESSEDTQDETVPHAHSIRQ